MKKEWEQQKSVQSTLFIKANYNFSESWKWKSREAVLSIGNSEKK